MFYSDQKRWLEIAEKCRPQLYQKLCRPEAIVEAVADKAAFQQWRMQQVAKFDDLLSETFSEGDGFVLDFGQHLVGHVQLDLAIDGKSMGGPLRLKLVFAEVPAETAETFDPYPGSLSRAWLQDEIITIDQLPQRLVLPRRYAFRFLKIEVLACSFDYCLKIRDIACKTVSSAPPDLERYSDDSISPELREIDRVALRTLQNCLQSVPEDGPKRDRRLWLADSPLMAQVIYHSFANYDLYKRCLYLFAGTAYPDGRIAACVYGDQQPHHGTEFILDFAVMFGSYLLEYAEASGDWETAEQLWPVARRQIDFAEEYLDNNALFQDRGKWWIFIDWQPQLDKQAAMQGLFIYAYQKLAELAAALGHKGDEMEIRGVVKKMRHAASTLRSKDSPHYFLSGKDKQVSWASQVWMILAGMTTREEGAAILRKLLIDPQAVKPATPFIYHYAVEAMLICGLREEAVALLKSYWGGMLAFGATTFWEVFDPDDHYRSPYNSYLVNSYCHSWSCTPAYLIRKYLL